ncbi:MAG: ShlB/FhaC/HecB family hemolysin secretion/activation protein [Burkholderiales bacterium]|nr:ShlB/FhaC/HecB family hemolysin secretion/activation protein [Burkholderiales bacterium]
MGFGQRPAHPFPTTLAAAIGAAICAAPALAPAQAVPDAGSTLRQLAPPTLRLPRKPAPDAQIEAPARPILQPAPQIRFRPKAFRITGATVFPEAVLQSMLQDLVGREVGIADLGEAVGRITRFYSERGYPLATAYLPAQEIKDAVVEIVILEGRFGDINLLNRARVRDGVIASYLAPLSGRVVEEATLERQLLLIYDLPGVLPGKAVLAPGQAVGETDLRLEIDPSPAVTGSVYLDNHGNFYSGANEISAQFAVASPARLGDLLSVQLTKGAPGLEYSHLNYQLPAGGGGLRVGAQYSHVHYELGERFAALGLSGEAGSATAFFQYPLVRSRQSSAYVGLSYERRSLQDRIGAVNAVTDKDARLFQLTLTGDVFDAWGGDSVSAYSLRYGRGNLAIESPLAKAIDDATARTAGAYRKLSLNLVRLQGLPGRFSAYLSFYGQKAADNLDSSEKMVLGGVNGVRAYPQGEAAGDSGYVLSGELRHAFSLEGVPGSFQAGAFLDTGEVRFAEKPFSAQPNRRRLSGAGLSLGWTRANDFTLRAVLAQRLGGGPASAGRDTRYRGWLQAIKNF